MGQKQFSRALNSLKPSPQEISEVNAKHDELNKVMRAAILLCKWDQLNKKREEKKRKLDGGLKNPKFNSMMERLFPMANLTIDQIDKNNPLKTLQKLSTGFERYPVGISGKLKRETELLTTLKTLHKNKSENIKLKAENRSLKQKRERLLTNEKYSNTWSIKKLRLTKLKEELDEIDSQVNSVLDQNAKLAKDFENFQQARKQDLKFERKNRELWAYLRRKFCNEAQSSRYLRKEKGY